MIQPSRWGKARARWMKTTAIAVGDADGAADAAAAAGVAAERMELLSPVIYRARVLKMMMLATPTSTMTTRAMSWATNR